MKNPETDTLKYRIEEYRKLCKAQPPMSMEEKMTLLNEFFRVQNLIIAVARREKLVALCQHIFGLYKEQIEGACKAKNKRAFHDLVEAFLKDIYTVSSEKEREEEDGKEE